MAKQKGTKYIGTDIPESLWKRWRIALFRRGKTQKEALYKMIANYVRDIEDEPEGEENDE